MIKILESIDNNKEKEIVINVKDSEGQLSELLDDIKKTAAQGHTFDVVVDPDSEEPRAYEIDGDGSFDIKDIVESEVVEKSNEKEEKKEESVKSIDNFKKEHNLSDEDIAELKHYYKNPWNEYKHLSFVDYLYDLAYNDLLPEMLSESKKVKKEVFTKSNNIIDTLTDMYESMERVLDLWDENINRECLDNSKYPFDKSFDELLLDVLTWIRTTNNIYLNGGE